ncbi:uncharacterized protein [Glycine max]|uniref:uncharacterized protein n=1 Tax=Glycine max TaxID=3847 RepID=UPI000E21B9FA|nr:uncharacterized protein LOC113000210 [Glycine max]|eukprot:XP_025982672.1 uncharacterized protein LOC113000210 [Glycine max]
MKQAPDVHRRDVSFEIGDWVLIKLRPQRQASATREPYSKLAKHFYGPFWIIRNIGKVAYKVQLPEDSCIHPIFHCSLLKHFHSTTTEVEPILQLPLITDNNQPVIRLLTFVNSRWDNTTPALRLLVLVQ